MLAERLLSRAVRLAGARYLSFEPLARPALPGPRPGRRYQLYAHVPFCESLCPYCSFNRFPFEEARARAYFRSLRDELRLVKELGYDFRSLYVGGGTPTILVDELCATLDLARELFSIQEVSTETNPSHLVPRVVEPLAGRVERLSVGVQSFDDALLLRMGRHAGCGTGAETLRRLRAVAGRFRVLNVDMMFNFPAQTRAMLAQDIAQVRASQADQATFYPLMPSPAVAQSLAAALGRVDPAREAAFYGEIAPGLGEAFEPASAWAFSRRRGARLDEYIVEGDEYVGVGSGAFSYLDGTLYVNSFSLREYGQAIARRCFALAGARTYGRRAQMRYRLLMGLFGLRLDKAAFARDFGCTPERGLPLELAGLRLLGAFARNDAAAATLSERGRYLLVAMMREFFVGVNDLRDQARAALPPDERSLLFGPASSPAPAAVGRMAWDRLGCAGDAP